MNQSAFLHFLARRRTFFSLIVPLILVIFAKPVLPGLIAGVVLVLVGEGIRIWSAGSISKNKDLACTGPYAFVRNPLYVGSLFIAAGYCAMSGLWWSWLVMGALYFLFYVGTIVNEERHLDEVLGDAYRTYCHHVPRLIPRLTPYGTGAESAFRWTQVWYNREQWSIYGVAAFTAAFILVWSVRG